jgi:hypothetical protein
VDTRNVGTKFDLHPIRSTSWILLLTVLKFLAKIKAEKNNHQALSCRTFFGIRKRISLKVPKFRYFFYQNSFMVNTIMEHGWKDSDRDNRNARKRTCSIETFFTIDLL